MKRPQGFSLIEVMIAFVLLAVALGILVAILGGGLAQVRQADQATGATLLAESLLAEVGVLTPIEPGIRQGESADGRYRWTLEVVEVPDPAPLPEDTLALEPIELAGRVQVAEPVLYQLQLDVGWGQDEYQRELRFVGLRARYPLSPLESPE